MAVAGVGNALSSVAKTRGVAGEVGVTEGVGVDEGMGVAVAGLTVAMVASGRSVAVGLSSDDTASGVTPVMARLVALG